MVRIKGTDQPTCAQQLLGLSEPRRAVARAESNLIGRRWELAAVEGLLQRAIDGHGAVVGVVGSVGTGKSRLIREAAAMAARRGVDVFSAFCESHTSDIAFHVVARLLNDTNPTPVSANYRCTLISQDPVIHYDADFERAATVLDFQHRWVLPRGSL